MITAFDPSELFERNPKAQINIAEDIIVIDDYYLHYEDIYNMLSNCYAPKWRHSPIGRNFVDYYDCRPKVSISFGTIPCEIDLIKEFYKDYREKTNQKTELSYGFKEYNFFKWKQNIPDNTQQMIPHIDTDYASIIYMDKVCSGGIAFYEDKAGNLSCDEHKNLFCDVSKLNKRVIQSKPNRHIIFRAKRYHGGYIEDHNKYVDNWRMNECIFYQNQVNT